LLLLDAEFVKQVERGSVGIRHYALDRAEAGMFLGGDEGVDVSALALRDLLHDRLKRALLAEGADVLHFLRIDRVVDFEVRDDEGAQIALFLINGRAGTAARRRRDKNEDIALLLDGDSRRVDAFGLEKPHLTDTAGHEADFV